MELIDANAHGNVAGGVIMRMVDEAASIVAFKHSQNPDVVTARVETLNFMAPASSGPCLSYRMGSLRRMHRQKTDEELTRAEE